MFISVCYMEDCVGDHEILVHTFPKKQETIDVALSTPSQPITPFQIFWSVPALAMKSP